VLLMERSICRDEALDSGSTMVLVMTAAPGLVYGGMAA